MSARKSFDVARERKAPPPPPAAPPRRRRVRMPKAPLKERRREARKRLVIALATAVLIMAVLVLVGIWQLPVRVQSVEASGDSSESLVAIAKRELVGTYGYVLPRNSIFLFPEDSVRSAILTAHPEIAAVSITRSSFSSLRITPTNRASAFLWCGPERLPESICFEADAEGLVFKIAEPERAFAQGELKLYGALATATDDPIGARVSSASRIPEALRLVKTLRGLGASISAVQLRDDEADLFVESGTRITYVLGKEEAAAGLAAATFPTISLDDGSIEYVDLRFAKKVYVKPVGE